VTLWHENSAFLKYSQFIQKKLLKDFVMKNKVRTFALAFGNKSCRGLSCGDFFLCISGSEIDH
jgi:hypothetical protein